MTRSVPARSIQVNRRANDRVTRVQGSIGATGPDRGPFDRAVAHHRAHGEMVSILHDADVRLAVVGPPGRALAHGVAGRATVAMTGSDASRLELSAVADGCFDHGDAVAMVAEGSTMRSLTGDGQSRLLQWKGDDGATLVASSMASITAGVNCHVDRSWEDFLLGFGFLPDRRTLFENVTVSDVASEMTEPAGRRANVTVSHGPAIAPTETVEDDLLTVLESAVLRRAEGRDRHAVLLGGFDSALVCALLRRAGHEVSTFTYAFPDTPSMNQRNVDVLVERLGLDHHWVEIRPEDLDEGLRTLDRRLNHPSAQPHYQLHTVRACEVVRSAGFDLAFTGDGCDAAFLGYPTVNQRARLSSLLERIPSSAIRAGVAVAGAPRIEDRAGQVSRVTRSMLHAAALGWPASGHLPTRYLDERSLGRLRLGPAPTPAEPVADVRHRLAAAAGDLDPIRLAFHGQALSGASRVKIEGAVGFTGVSIYSPYNDARLKQMAAGIPTDQLRPGRSTAKSLGKSVLIDAVRRRGLLPDAVIDQPKQSPATSPIDAWLSGPLRPTVLEMLDGLPFEWDRRYVDTLLAPKALEELYRRKVTLSRHALQAVGLLVSYAAFTRRAG